MTALGSPFLALALLASAAPPEKSLDYEKQLNDKLGEGVAPEQNVQVLLFKAFGPKPEGASMPEDFYKRLGMAEPPENGDYIVGVGKFVKDHLQLEQSEWDDVFKQQGWASNRPWAAKDYPFIGAWVKQNEKPLAIVHEAVKRPKYYNPMVSRKTPQDPHGSLIGVLLSSVQKCREVASLLTARAMLRLQEGKTEEAWADLMDCHRLARHVATGGTLIELLVGIAIDAIASNADIAFLENAKLNSKQTLEKLKDLQGLPPFAKAADKVDVTERIMFLDCLRLIRGGAIGVLEDAIGGGKGATEEEKKALAVIDWAPAEVAGRKWYDRMVAAMRKPNRAERNRALDALDAELKAMKEGYAKDVETIRKGLVQDPKGTGPAVAKVLGDVLVSLVSPAVRKVQDAGDRQLQLQSNLHTAFALVSDRQLQLQSNLHTAFALVAYQREHGKYPAKLDDLAPKFIATEPGDVFSGGALKYLPEEKGFLIYSVGANGMDEGGRWYDDEPRGDDPRVRLPLPSLKKD